MVRAIGLASALFVALLAAAALAAGQPVAVDVAAIGPQVGELLPDFELRDQHGNPRRFSSLVGPNGAMLVFYRSADW